MENKLPKAFPVFPLRYSKRSGFFIWGIIDEPVTILSERLIRLKPSEFQMINSLGSVWNIFLMPLGAALFLITMIAEVERTPFDMPEAEAELVEGWWTEYGGMRWGLMFAAEYLRTYAECLLFAHFFLGGWEAPFEDTIPYISYVPHIVWVLLKSWFMFIFFVHYVSMCRNNAIWI